jgi:hypothetical protein
MAHIMLQHFHQCQAVERTLIRTHWNAAYAHQVNMDSSAVVTVMKSNEEQKISTEITL